MAFEMKDKLSQLKGGYYEDCAPDEDQIEWDEEEKQWGGFFATIDDISMAISQISISVEQIECNYSIILSIILSSVKTRAPRDKNDDLMGDVRKLSRKVHVGLKRLKVEIDEEEQGPNRNTADFRIKKAQYVRLSRTFRDVMRKFNQAQEDYREGTWNKLKRLIQYTGKCFTEDQLEEMLEADNVAIYTADIMIDTAEKRQALSEVETRHEEIKQLEANMRELQQMFYDMVLLVEEQGDLINCIEYNIETATSYVKRPMKVYRSPQKKTVRGRMWSALSQSVQRMSLTSRSGKKHRNEAAEEQPASCPEESDCAELKDLVTELHGVTDWFPLGLNLDVPKADLSIIESDYRLTEERLRHMLMKWGEVEIPTWSKLVSALNAIGMKQLAREISSKKKLVR